MAGNLEGAEEGADALVASEAGAGTLVGVGVGADTLVGSEAGAGTLVGLRVGAWPFPPSPPSPLASIIPHSIQSGAYLQRSGRPGGGQGDKGSRQVCVRG